MNGIALRIFAPLYGRTIPMEKTIEDIGEALKGPVESLSKSSKMISSTLDGLVNEVESIIHSFDRFFSLFRGHSEEIKDSAKALVAPAVAAGVNYLGKNKGKALVRSAA